MHALVVAALVTGHVYVDLDGDGAFSPGDRRLAGVQVAFETDVFDTTRADGAYALDVPGDGIVWARVPDGYRPPAPWAAVVAAGGAHDLALRPADSGDAGTFVVGSDLHVGRAEVGRTTILSTEAVLAALDQALARSAPRFIALTGDLVQSNQPEQYDRLLAVRDALDVPLVPVPGNHDWFDGGASYRAALGPPMYSFDSDGARFVVLNDNATTARWSAFLDHELAGWPASQPVVAFAHKPPTDEQLALLEAAGVDDLFTGHWHGNTPFTSGGMLHFNTEPLVRGGADGTPAGFRIITLHDGAIDTRHESVVDRDLVELVAPAPDQCLDEDEIEIVVAVAGPLPAKSVVVAIGGVVVPLAPRGGWDWSAPLDLAGARPSAARITVMTEGAVIARDVALHACTCAAAAAMPGEWRQVQGSATHAGVGSAAIASPLRTRWVAATGGHPSGAPIVADGKVFVSLADYDRGAAAAVVALDLDSGAERWRYAPGSDVRNSVAVADGIVVVATVDGRVHGVDEDSGAARWVRDIGTGPAVARALHAAPTIADGVVYIGTHRNFVALDVATGDVLWQRDPEPRRLTMVSRAAAAVGGGLVVGLTGRGRDGVFAWDATTGEERWRFDGPSSEGLHAAPLIDGDTVYLVNAAAELIAVDLASGVERWRTQVLDGLGAWDYAVLATPARAGVVVVVPTQYDDLVAIDVADGSERWRVTTTEGVLHDAHGRTTSSSFPSSPVVAGDTVWVIAGDGRLSAITPDTGEVRGHLDLGVPGNGGLAAAGEILVAATYDGSVRAMIHDTCVDLGAGDAAPGDAPGPPTGCGCAAGDTGGWPLVVLLLVLVRRSTLAR